ncbi:hypothetical protein BD289DRAFT_211514 [Coniella lustricola]|uniref:Zn(2)-C6 fungal-type domain-containing protein n=1 Tax=Coniella lustricola TaxID=2025994 RepID=A0A2T3ABW7_9PEZI|nr:hypothetical protein BD289DRAFT_211514 [Coniella lustricola]
MDDLFLDASKTTYPCASVDDLKHQLVGLRLEKVTDKTARHISATFEFHPTAVFTIPESEGDKDGASPGQNLDPALDGGTAANAKESDDPAPTQVPSVATRVITVQDTILNQPADNPVFQKVVARHILANLGSADNSSWVVRSVSRNSTGWTFQYDCRSSIQEWKRQNAKHAATMLIAKSSGRDGQDAIAAARPAFNCRGSVTVAFSKSGRTIKVRLEHTPIHKTVADLAELYKPSPPPPRVETARPHDKESKKRKSQAADGVNGAERSKKKRKDKSATPDDPTADGSNMAKVREPRPSRSKKTKAAAAAAQNGGGDTQPVALLNLSPSEAARRHDEAKRKLSESGIDPTTLSSEQFGIFANQSPDLQNESLAMLIKYGAERLRIVHPDKGKASSASPPPANATPKSSGKKKSKRSHFNPDGTPKIKRTRGSCQTCRNHKTKCDKAKPECSQCTEAGVACFYPPEKKRGAQQGDGGEEIVPAEPDTISVMPLPEQAQTQDQDHSQERDEHDEEEAEPEPEPEPEATPEADQTPEDDNASDLGSPTFHNSYITVPGQPPAPIALAPEYAEVPHNLYRPDQTNASYSQPAANEVPPGVDYTVFPEAVQSRPPQNGMVYPYQAQPASQVTYPDLLNTPPTQAAVPTAVQPVQAAQPPAPVTDYAPSQPSDRRSLPNKSAQSEHAYSNPANTNNTNAPSWQSQSVSANAVNTTSIQAFRGARPEVTSASTHENTPQRDPLQAALQRSDQAPVARTVSPFQNPKQAAQAARIKSDQSQRSQSRRQITSPFQQAPTTRAGLAKTAAMYTTANSASTNSVSSYDQQQQSYTNAVPNQRSQTSPTDIREPYALQNGHDKATSSYANYDAYTAGTQASGSTGLTAPLSRGAASPATVPQASHSVVWPAPDSMDSNPHHSSKTAAPAAPIYSSESQHNLRTSQHQYESSQQPQITQDNNPRRRSNAHVSSGSTSLAYGTKDQTRSARQRQQAQQQQQQQPIQQAYNQYAAQQSHHNATQQQQQQQQQNSWYGMRSIDHENPIYGSNSQQHAKQYSHSGSDGTASYTPHNAMNLSGNTYQSLNQQQEFYEMFRNNPTH